MAENYVFGASDALYDIKNTSERAVSGLKNSGKASRLERERRYRPSDSETPYEAACRIKREGEAIFRQ